MAIPSIDDAFTVAPNCQSKTDLIAGAKVFQTKIQEANNRGNISNRVGAQLNDAFVQMCQHIARELTAPNG
jgi:hypothetical protein